MKFDWKHILLIILLGFLAGWFFFSNKQSLKEEKSLNDSVIHNRNLYLTYKNSVDHMKIIHAIDSSMFDSVVNLKLKERWHIVIDTQYVPDTSKPKLCESLYSDSLVKNRFKLKYDIWIADCYIKDIRFHHIVFPVDTVKLPPVNICVNDTVKVDKKLSKYGVWVGMNYFDFKSFPLMQVGGFYFFKDKGFIQVGGGFDAAKGFNKKALFGALGIGINLR